MSRKESPTQRELGPKKYRELVEKQNSNYDKYKSGKIDPVTGIRNKEIFFNNPNQKKSIGSKYVGSFECECSYVFGITNNTVLVSCPMCKNMYTIKYNRDTKEFTVDVTKT